MRLISRERRRRSRRWLVVCVVGGERRGRVGWDSLDGGRWCGVLVDRDTVRLSLDVKTVAQSHQLRAQTSQPLLQVDRFIGGGCIWNTSIEIRTLV